MPVAIDGRRRLAPEARRNLLLTHAVEIFSVRGIGRGGHTEIAELGGVSVATVFNYFNTRETLVEAVLSEVESYFLSLASDVYEQIDDPLEALKTHMKAFLFACDENPTYVKVWLEWSSSVRDETWPSYIAFQNRLLDLMEVQIQKAIDKNMVKPEPPARERSRWLLGNAQMLVTMLFDPSGRPEDLEGMVERGFDHVLGVH